MNPIAPSLAQNVQTFFADYLVAQRDMSGHTVLAYRDALKLFLSFVARVRKKTVADLGFDDITPEGVLAFLEDIEKRRKNSVRTRNARLAALRTFFRYVAAREPQLLDLCQRISAIPIKKTSTPTVVYIEYAELLHVLAHIDRKTPRGRRDYLLLRLLFETGAYLRKARSRSNAPASAAEPVRRRREDRDVHRSTLLAQRDPDGRGVRLTDALPARCGAHSAPGQTPASKSMDLES